MAQAAQGAPEHRAGTGPSPSSRSLRGLDGLNLLMADVRDGVGPYLSIFLSGTRHWEAGPIGVAMAMSNIAMAVCQVPAGMLVDASRFKRLLVGVAATLVGAGCLLIVVVPGQAAVYAAQAALGAASAVIPPVLVTAPVDRRLVTEAAQVTAGPARVRARVLSDRPVTLVEWRADYGPWQPMAPGAGGPAVWEADCPRPAGRIAVRAADADGRRDCDDVEPADAGWTRPDVTADGSDAARLAAWESRGLLGTQLGPNRNGRQW